MASARETTVAGGNALFRVSYMSGDVTDYGEIGDPELAIWKRQMPFVTDATIEESLKEFDFAILAARLQRMGLPMNQLCKRRKGFGCRSILLGGKEYALSGGRFSYREIKLNINPLGRSGRRIANGLPLR